MFQAKVKFSIYALLIWSLFCVLAYMYLPYRTKNRTLLDTAYLKASIKTLKNVTFQDSSFHSIPSSFFINKVLIIAFWAPGCGPCMDELPLLEKLSEKYASNSKVIILYACIDKYKVQFKNVVRNIHLNYPYVNCVYDAKNRIYSKFGVNYIPYQIVVKKNGNLVGVGTTVSDYPDEYIELMEKNIDQLIYE